MSIYNFRRAILKLVVMISVLVFSACSMIPTEGSASRYTSGYDRNSGFVNDFDIRSVTGAPEQIVVMFRVDETPDRTFELVSELDQISTWFTDIKNPSVDNSRSVNGPDALGLHSVRSCSLEGEQLVEDIVYYEKSKRAYAYAINQELSTVSFPISEPVSLFTVESDREGGSLVTWRHYFKKDFHIAAPFLTFMMEQTIIKPAVENLFEQHGGEWVETI